MALPANHATGQTITAADVNAIETAVNALSGTSGQGLPSTVVSKTSAYTAAAGEFVKADTSSAGLTVTLPTNPAAGALVAVKKVSADTNTLTIAAAGGGTIDGSATATTVTQYAGVIVEHVGSNVWHVAASMSTTGPAGTNGTNGTNGAISVIQDEGTPLTVRGALNFVGASVSAADDAANSRTNVTITATSAIVGLLPRALVTGRYMTTPGTIATLNMSTGYEYAFPFEVYASTSFTAIGLNVTTAQTAGLVRLGVRADNGGLPGAVVFDAGSNIDASTTGFKEVAISQTLPAGIYWLCGRATGGAGASVQGTQNMPVVISSSTQAGAMSNVCSGFTDNGGGSGAISGTMAAFVQATILPRIVLKAA